MPAWGLNLGALVLLSWLCPYLVTSQGLGSPTPQNSSSGVPVVSLQWPSVRAPFLAVLWTLVAASSILGKPLRRASL